MKRAVFLILTLLVTSCPVFGARTIDLDVATIADIDAAFKAGTLTAEELVQMCLARIRSSERLEDFRQELRDRYGPLPEPAEWLMRLAELRLLAAKWQIATVHLDKPAEGAFGPTDVVLGYRSAKRVRLLAERSEGRLRVVDQDSAYFRLLPKELEPPAMYHALKELLRP